MENRDNRGRFTNLRRKCIEFVKAVAFILVALVYVPVSGAWATQQLVSHVRGAEVARYTAPVMPTFDRRSEMVKELRPQYEEALQIAVDRKLAEQDKKTIEKQLEELRKKELDHPLP